MGAGDEVSARYQRLQGHGLHLETSRHLGRLERVPVGLAHMDSAQLADTPGVCGTVLHHHPNPEVDGGQVWEVEREECRLLLERLSVHLLVVRRLCMCAGDGGPVFQAWLVFHVLRTCDVVRRWPVRLLCGLVYLLQGG